MPAKKSHKKTAAPAPAKKKSKSSKKGKKGKKR